LDARKEVGQEGNAEKTKYLFMSLQKTTRRNTYMTVGIDRLKCGKVQIFGNAVRKQNCIHEEIESRLNSGNAWYHAVQVDINPDDRGIDSLRNVGSKLHSHTADRPRILNYIILHGACMGVKF
jgi:hypothetical protein